MRTPKEKSAVNSWGQEPAEEQPGLGQRVLAALDLTGEGLLMTDGQGRIIYGNAAASALLGQDSPAALRNLSWRSLGLPSPPLDALPLDNHAAWPAGGGGWSGEVALRKGEATTFLALRLTQLKEGGSIAILTDITERRQRDEERHRLERHLQQTRRVEALDQLAGGLAHDFNNLLGAILGFANFIAEDTPEGSPSNRYAQRILAVGDRANGLIGQILAFTRRTGADRKTCDLTALIDDVSGLLCDSLPPTTRLSVDLAGAPVVIEADREQMSRIVLNLVLNGSEALDGMAGTVRVALSPTNPAAPELRRLAARTPPEPSGAIDLWAEPDGGCVAVSGVFAEDRPHISLVVTDSGSGLSMEVLERAFDPFFTTKGKGRGSGLGLGLAAVHNIVLAHDGAIVVHTRPGAGTRFEVVLPLSAAAVVPASLPDNPAAIPPMKTRLLLVDDDMDFGDMLMTALERRGLEVAACSSPLEAMDALREEPAAWDVLVTDQTMPDMRGIDLVKAVKAQHPDLPCIICTASEESLDEASLKASGVFALLHKPLDIAQFLDAVARAIHLGTMPSNVTEGS